MSNQERNDAVREKCARRVIAILQHVDTDDTVIPVSGARYEIADVVALYLDCLRVRDRIETVRSELAEAIAARDLAEVKRQGIDRALKSWVTNRFGADSEQAHAFGFPPRKEPVRREHTKRRRFEAWREARADADETAG